MTWDDTYPRPQLRRSSFFALHHGWTLNGQTIHMPWPPQAPLSGYKGDVGDKLRYETDFALPEGFLSPNHRLMLHFGAVDRVAEVFLNGCPVIRHEGGYLPFSANITELLRQPVNKLTVLVTDTLSHDYPWGKQHRRPHGMWYTPVSGIWQTVWLEAVPERGAIRGLYEEMVLPSILGGLCGCIYTQLSDVEGETNGLYTYDRQVCKVPPVPMRRIREDIETALHDAVTSARVCTGKLPDTAAQTQRSFSGVPEGG